MLQGMEKLRRFLMGAAPAEEDEEPRASHPRSRLDPIDPRTSPLDHTNDSNPFFSRG
jgi:hypothetical protein